MPKALHLNPENEPEKAFLVGLARPTEPSSLTAAEPGLDLSVSLSELEELARTAGLVVVGRTSQRLKAIQAGTLVGPGKAGEIRAAAVAAGAGVILFDDELSPGQQKNLEKLCGEEVKVLDRTALILDIFAAHARSNEGKLQVELAQYTYRLPRLTRLWTHLARQAGGRRGGVGLRGPGETQLEMDRRAIRRKIQALTGELESVRRQRGRLREKRRSEGFFTIALAGYTNAGKSTLLNALSKARLETENMLFSTLDPTTRRVKLPGGLKVLVTDTVGFISKLPHHLVAAFRATFEEIGEADLILHLVDASHPHARLQQAVVERELARIRSDGDPVLLVFNKLDRLTPQERQHLPAGRPAVSALTGSGLSGLLAEMERFCARRLVPVVFRFPYGEGKARALVHEYGTEVAVIHEEADAVVKALVPGALKKRLRRFVSG